jgi:hypothetical protein
MNRNKGHKYVVTGTGYLPRTIVENILNNEDDRKKGEGVFWVLTPALKRAESTVAPSPLSNSSKKPHPPSLL